MKLGALKAPFDFFHGSRLNLVTLILIALAAYECAELILSGDRSTLYYAAFVVFGIVAVVAIFKNWRTGLYCFVAWILFEDLARKFLGNNMIIYFAKDFLALVVYVAVLVAYHRGTLKSFRPPFRLPLLFFVFWGLLQMFNPGSP